MSTPEALRIADAIDRDGLMVASSVIFDDAPAELRRQHAEIERLTAERDALHEALQRIVDWDAAGLAPTEDHINQARAALAATPAPAPLTVPHPGSPEASAMMDSEMQSRGWPANPKNAARAGYEACRKLMGIGTADTPAPHPDTADAERYRWLREHGDAGCTEKDGYGGQELRIGEDLDAAIDAARAQAQGGKP